MRRLWLLCFVVVLAGAQLAVGMRASATASVTGDEPFYLLSTQSLLSDGDLELDDEYRNGEERRFWDGRVPLWKQMAPTADGRLLAPHDPGLSLLVLPAYWAGGLRGAQRFLAVLWALAAACAAVLARRAGAPPWAAALGAVVVGLGTPGVVYASQVYPEGAAALLVALALLVVSGGRPRPLLLVVPLVALAWLGVKYVPLAVLVACAWAWRFRAHSRSLVMAGGLATLAAGHFLWWHVHTFGGLTPYASNVVWAGEGTAAILGHHLSFADRSYRVYGLFLDARFGLFRWLPVAVVAAWGLGRKTALHAAVLVTCVVMATFVSITIMGWWFPGRLLVAGFPALTVLVALGAARVPRLALALSAWSLAVGAALVWAARTGAVHLAVDPFTLGFPLPPKALFPDFRTFTWRQAALSSLWIVAIAAAVYATARRERPEPRVAEGTQSSRRPRRVTLREGPGRGGGPRPGGTRRGRTRRGRSRHPAP